MTTPLYPTVWYFVVGDTNPTTQVWESVTGQMVGNTAANYLSWVANGGQLSFFGQQQVRGVADDGTGLVKVMVDVTAVMTTGDAWVVQNVTMTGATIVNGTWIITVNDATHITLQGSAFIGGDSWVSGGVVDRGQPTPTMSALLALINSYNLTLPRIVFPPTIASAVGITLTNPLSLFYNINMTAAGQSLTLPQMNLFGSVPIGIPFYLHPTAVSNPFTVRSFNGTALEQADANDNIAYMLLNNNTQNGTIARIYTPAFLRGLKAGTTDAAIPIVQVDGTSASWLNLSGDATLADTGVLTFASTIVAGGPTGDATHVAQITYDAKGRLTAVTSVAITGTPPGGAAGGDLSGTYPNPSLANIPNDTTVAGDLLATAIAAPATPAAGKGRIYVDSTSKNIVVKDDAGVVKHGAQTKTAAAHKFFTALSDAGVFTDTQPASADLSAVTDGSSAAAGTIGEIISSNIPSGSAVALTSSVVTNITSITLTAGDWDIWGYVNTSQVGGVNCTVFYGILTDTSASFPTISPTTGALNSFFGAGSNNIGSPAGQLEISVNANKQFWIAAYSVFTGGTSMSAYGYIVARRRR